MSEIKIFSCKMLISVLVDKDRMTDIYGPTGRGSTTGLLSLTDKGSVSVRSELSGKDSMSSSYVTFFCKYSCIKIGFQEK